MFLPLFLSLTALQQAPDPLAPRDLAAALREAPQLEAFRELLADPPRHRLQVLLAEPVVVGDRVLLRRSAIGDARQYFYPASSIKLCGAIAALLALQQLAAESGAPHGLQTRLEIEPLFAGDLPFAKDESNLDGGAPTVAHALRKLFLVSDNVAYNHCLELVGQRGVNEAMWRGGFASVRLWHRLSEARSLEENRRTRPVVVRSGREGSGGTVTKLPARDAGVDLVNDLWRDLDVGTGAMHGGRLVEGPMSFAQKNAVRLQDLQDVLVEVVRPEIDTGKRGFPELSLPHRAFLVQALGELPRESVNPRYDPAKTPDHACKFVLRGVRRVVPAEHLRIYDKIGRAYGFSVENAYVEDTRTGRGFFLAVVLYTNADGVLNDDRYEYEPIADAFLDAVGETVARIVFPAYR